MSLFGRLYMANELRERDPVSFSHENQLYPPALSDHNNMRLGKKSDLIEWVEPDVVTDSIAFDCKIFDGMALVNLLNPLQTNRFTDYIENIFTRHIKRELECYSRIDIVWDQYFSHSIKESMRQKWGTGVRKKVNLTAEVPNDRLHFLRNSSNKCELIKSLNTAISIIQVEEGKLIVTASDNSIISIGNSSKIPNCNQDEDDTCVVIHALNAFQSKLKKTVIQTTETLM